MNTSAFLLPVRGESAASAPGWYWVVPRVALLLFLLAIAILMWWLHRNDLEKQRATMISDVLWMEQDLRFHLDHNAEQIAQLGREAIDQRPLTPPTALSQARPAWPENSARRCTSRLYAAPDGDVQFDLLVPLGAGNGWMRGTYSIAQMLSQSVPWWFAERYKLDVIDNTEHVLASKSKVAAGHDELNYALVFDPPGHVLRLRVTAYRSDTRLLPALLVAAIVGLALTMLWSLWALRRHLQRRLAAEQALRKEHAFRTAMENSLIIGLRARDLTGRITHVNPAFCRMVGWSAAELMAMQPPSPTGRRRKPSRSTRCTTAYWPVARLRTTPSN